MASDTFRNVRDDAKDRLAGDLDQLKSNFAQLRSDVGQILSNAVGAGKSTARGGVDAARDQANAAVERVREGYDDLKSRGSDEFEHLSDLIAEKPVVAAAIAFGVGFLIAKVLIRR